MFFLIYFLLLNGIHRARVAQVVGVSIGLGLNAQGRSATARGGVAEIFRIKLFVTVTDNDEVEEGNTWSFRKTV